MLDTGISNIPQHIINPFVFPEYDPRRNKLTLWGGLSTLTGGFRLLGSTLFPQDSSDSINAETPFQGLRESLAMLGGALDHFAARSTQHCAVFQDDQQTSAVLMRVSNPNSSPPYFRRWSLTLLQLFDTNVKIISVRMVNAQTPIVIVKFKRSTRDNLTEALQWLSHVKPADTTQIRSTLIEQNLLLRLLHYNSQMVPVDALRSSPNFKKSYEKSGLITHAEDRANFRWSFILPIGEIAGDSRDEMDADAKKGCAVCGVRCAQQCGGCRSIFYCSAGKQTFPEIQDLCSLKSRYILIKPTLSNRAREATLEDT